jgi:thiamine biosynthesis lipoprotein
MKSNAFMTAVVGLFHVVLLTGCEVPQTVFDDRINVLGTNAEITIIGLSDAGAREAAEAVEHYLGRLDHVGYTFKPEGELHELNEAIARGSAMSVSPELKDLINTAKKMYTASDGLINPAAGELVALWEFHCEKEDCDESPFPEEVRQLVVKKGKKIIESRPSMSDLIITGDVVSSVNPAVKLEFGDMIRGYALDKAREHVKKAGVQNAKIDIGGNIRSLGKRGEHPWWAPLWDEYRQHSNGYIELDENEALVTVRAFDRSMGSEDYVYRHVIDPRSGLPVSEIQFVTVLHEKALVANTAAAALLVAGLDDWAKVAKKTGVRSVMMVTRDGVIYTSTTMEERIHWNERPERQHLVP